MLKIIARTILVLIVAGLVSGGLYVIAKSNTGRAWLGVAAQNPPASRKVPSAAPASQGSGAATLKSSSGSQNSRGSRGSQDGSNYQPNTLMDVLQKLGIVLLFTVGVVILQKILSLFIKNHGDTKTFKAD
jgi:hypothetical protein